MRLVESSRIRMNEQFTPLNIEKIKDNQNNINVILLAILTLVTFILATSLFILIQKKIAQPPPTLPEPTSLPTPTLILSPTVEATPSSVTP